jgi:hypothetical protein
MTSDSFQFSGTFTLADYRRTVRVMTSPIAAILPWVVLAWAFYIGVSIVISEAPARQRLYFWLAIALGIFLYLAIHPEVEVRSGWRHDHTLRQQRSGVLSPSEFQWVLPSGTGCCNWKDTRGSRYTGGVLIIFIPEGPPISLVSGLFPDRSSWKAAVKLVLGSTYPR